MHFIDYYLFGEKNDIELNVTMRKVSDKLNISQQLMLDEAIAPGSNCDND